MDFRALIGGLFTSILSGDDEQISKKEFAVLKKETDSENLFVLLDLVHTHRGALTVAKNLNATEKVLLKVLDTSCLCSELLSKVVGNPNATIEVSKKVVNILYSRYERIENDHKEFVMDQYYEYDSDSDKLKKIHEAIEEKFPDFKVDIAIEGEELFKFCMDYLKTKKYEENASVIKALLIKESVSAELLKKFVDKGYLNSELEELVINKK